VKTTPTPAARDPAAPRRVLGAATVVGDYTTLLLARLLSVILSVASVALTTRILAPEGVGLVAYVTVLATLVFTVGSTWTSGVVSRYGREEFERTASLLNVTWERFIITAPLVAVTTVALVVLEAFGALSPGLSWLLIAIACAYGVVLVLSDHLVYVLQAVGQVRASAFAVIVRQAAVVAGLLAVVATGVGRTPAAVAGITAAAWFVVTPALAARVWHVGVWPPRLDPKLRRRMLVFAIPMIGFTVSQYVVQTVDFAVIGWFRGTADVGVYAVAYQGYTVLQNVAAAAVPILTPLFVSLRAAGREPLVGRFYARVVAQVTFAASAAVGGGVPCVPFLVPVVFGQDFGGASDPLVLLLGSTVLLFGANLLAPIIVLHEATRAVGWINLAAAGANVVADLVLIGVFGVGIVGASVGTLAATSCIAVGYDRLVARRLGVAPRLRPIVFAPAAVGIAAGIFLPGAAALGGAVAAVAVAVAVAARANLFAAEDAALVAALDIPAPAKRLLTTVIERAARGW